jgi:hypothetical protein
LEQIGTALDWLEGEAPGEPGGEHKRE